MTREKERIVVLGAGLSGLAAATVFSDADAVVVSKGFGLGYDAAPGPVYFYVSRSTGMFLRALGLEPGVKQVRWGIKIGERLLDPAAASGSDMKYFRMLYNLKARGRALSDVGLSQPPAAQVYDVPVKAVYEAASRKLDVVFDEVVEVDLPGRRLIGLDGEYRFCALISTVPLPALIGLAGFPEKLKAVFAGSARTLYFREAPGSPEEVLGPYDYVYVLDSDTPVYRVARAGGSSLVYEQTVPPDTGSWSKVPYGKILHRPAVAEVLERELAKYRCFLVGRYARWAPGYLVSHAVRDALKIRATLDA